MTLVPTIHNSNVLFRIRDFRAADFDRLWRIDQLCFPPGIAYSQMELNGFIMKRNAITLVGELEPGEAALSPEPLPETPGNAVRVSGFVVSHSIRRKYGRILTLDILPEARRVGLATGLMIAVEERLRALGCQQIFLETAVDNDAALRLYHKLGYTILRTLPEYYASHSLDAFQMGKQL
jgi:[ribosomal protein S18]-alanine N-acetyltransferase